MTRQMCDSPRFGNLSDASRHPHTKEDSFLEGGFASLDGRSNSSPRLHVGDLRRTEPSRWDGLGMYASHLGAVPQVRIILINLFSSLESSCYKPLDV